MDPQTQRDKLAMIDRLPAGELLGWWEYLGKFRPNFPGEKVALEMRAKRLGVTLPQSLP
jgi:hypothetical protein